MTRSGHFITLRPHVCGVYLSKFISISYTEIPFKYSSSPSLPDEHVSEP